MAAGPAEIADGTNLACTGYGQVRVAASQAGNSNYNPAAAVTNAFNALGPQVAVLGTNGAVVASGNVPAAGNGTAASSSAAVII